MEGSFIEFLDIFGCEPSVAAVAEDDVAYLLSYGPGFVVGNLSRWGGCI